MYYFFNEIHKKIKIIIYFLQLSLILPPSHSISLCKSPPLQTGIASLSFIPLYLPTYHRLCLKSQSTATACTRSLSFSLVPPPLPHLLSPPPQPQYSHYHQAQPPHHTAPHPSSPQRHVVVAHHASVSLSLPRVTS